MHANRSRNLLVSWTSREEQSCGGMLWGKQLPPARTATARATPNPRNIGQALTPCHRSLPQCPFHRHFWAVLRSDPRLRASEARRGPAPHCRGEKPLPAAPRRQDQSRDRCQEYLWRHSRRPSMTANGNGSFTTPAANRHRHIGCAAPSKMKEPQRPNGRGDRGSLLVSLGGSSQRPTVLTCRAGRHASQRDPALPVDFCG
jgi:hypothetical protein